MVRTLRAGSEDAAADRGQRERRRGRVALAAAREKGRTVHDWLVGHEVTLPAGAGNKLMNRRYGVTIEGNVSLPKTVVIGPGGEIAAIYSDETGDFCGDLVSILDRLRSR